MTDNRRMRDESRAGLPPVSVEEQRAMGLVRYQGGERNNYVPAAPQPPSIPNTNHSVVLDVTPTAQQSVIMHTSAVDRAKGYQIAIAPLALALGVLAVLVSLFFDNQLLSLATLLIFWLTFVAAWVVGWAVTALATPEAVSLYEAKRKWDVVEREQRERWGYYHRLTGDD